MIKLNKKGIGAASYYATPIHKTPFYRKKILLSNTDWAAAHVLSIPIHPKVSVKNLQFMAKNLKELV